MSLRIKIDDPTVTTRDIAMAEGKTFTSRTQSGILYAGKFVYPCKLRLEKDQVFAPGEYLVEDESFGIDEYDNIAIRKGGLKLKSALVAAARGVG
jgi:hypothetical protein